MAKVPWQWTIHELASLIPNGAVILPTEGQLQAIAQRGTRHCSVWEGFYLWLGQAKGYIHPQLHNLTYVGNKLMGQLRQLEKARIRRHYRKHDESLEHLVAWSNVGSGPMESVMGWPIRGQGLCVLPCTEDRQRRLTEAWRRKLDQGNREILRKAAGDTFVDWVLSLTGYQGGLADLAEDMRTDPNFPRTDTYAVARRYMHEQGACEAALDCLHDAWNAYQGSLAHKPAFGPIGSRQRFRILKRDHYRCKLCGRSAKDGMTLHVDHIVARANGGSNDDRNLLTLCQDCNLGKSTHPL